MNDVIMIEKFSEGSSIECQGSNKYYQQDREGIFSDPNECILETNEMVSLNNIEEDILKLSNDLEKDTVSKKQIGELKQIRF